MKIEFNYQTKVLTLPQSVVQKMETATEQDLRVLLLLASDPAQLENFNPAKLSSVLDLSEQQIELSIAFWRGAGVLKTGRSAKQPSEEQPASEAPRAVITPETVRGGQPVYTGTEIEKLMKERKELAGLLKECQKTLEKVFNVTESNKIISLYDYLHLSADYILQLAKHCQLLGKGTVAYVTATAYQLYNQDIVTAQALEEYIEAKEKLHDFENFIRPLCGFGGRKLSKKEQKFIENWEKMNLPEEVISYAYEQSVDATGELSMPHLNKILEGFKAAGVRDLKDAEKCAEQHREEMKKLYGSGKAGKSKDQSEFKSFDADEFFNVAIESSKNELKK